LIRWIFRYFLSKLHYIFASRIPCRFNWLPSLWKESPEFARTFNASDCIGPLLRNLLGYLDLEIRSWAEREGRRWGNYVSACRQKFCSRERSVRSLAMCTRLSDSSTSLLVAVAILSFCTPTSENIIKMSINRQR